MRVHVRKPRWGLLTLFAVLPFLASCSTSGIPAATPWPVPSTSAESADPPAATIPMPDLGPSPTPVPLTDGARESLRLTAQDAQWQSVVDAYPNAVRPEVKFEGYLASETRVKILSECYESRGVAFAEGTDADGNIVGLSPSTTNEAETVATYACDAAHPPSPVAPPSPEILGYLYDYLTEFVVPCYEANGVANPEPPAREEFVARWPNQNWFPSLEGGQAGTSDEAIEEACPLPLR